MKILPSSGACTAAFIVFIVLMFFAAIAEKHGLQTTFFGFLKLMGGVFVFLVFARLLDLIFPNLRTKPSTGDDYYGY